MKMYSLLLMSSVLFFLTGHVRAQVNVATAEGKVIPWKQLADDHKVKTRTSHNTVVMKLVTNDPIWGTGYTLSGKNNSSLILADSPFATSSGASVSIAMFGGSMKGGSPDARFYFALGIGASLELPDQLIRIFGVEIKGGSIVIAESGILLSSTRNEAATSMTREQVAKQTQQDSSNAEAAPADVKSQYDLGVAALERQDYATARRIFRALAEQGQADAQYALGVTYEQGEGVPQDDTLAVSWYRKAAEQGDASGQRALGFMYFNGRGVPQDHAAALNWYRKAAEQGEAEAQNAIGHMYSEGLGGVSQDYAAALSWYRKAAEQGVARAQFTLGWRYRRGRQGVSRDYAAALNLYRKAADQGFAGAQFELGLMYGLGEGTKQNDVLALMWVDLSLSRATMEAIRTAAVKAHQMLEARMSREQVAEAKRRVSMWMPIEGTDKLSASRQQLLDE